MLPSTSTAKVCENSIDLRNDAAHESNAQGHTNFISDVRGRGLKIGVEVVNKNLQSDDRGAHPAFPEPAEKIQQECFKPGLSVEIGRRHRRVIRLLPSLMVTGEHIDKISDIFREAVMTAEASVQ